MTNTPQVSFKNNARMIDDILIDCHTRSELSEKSITGVLTFAETGSSDVTRTMHRAVMKRRHFGVTKGAHRATRRIFFLKKAVLHTQQFCIKCYDRIYLDKDILSPTLLSTTSNFAKSHLKNEEHKKTICEIPTIPPQPYLAVSLVEPVVSAAGGETQQQAGQGSQGDAGPAAHRTEQQQEQACTSAQITQRHLFTKC